MLVVRIEFETSLNSQTKLPLWVEECHTILIENSSLIRHNMSQKKASSSNKLST